MYLFKKCKLASCKEQGASKNNLYENIFELWAKVEKLCFAKRNPLL